LRYRGLARGGSWWHMAPEQFPDPHDWPMISINRSSDVYAAVASLLDCLVGHPPFKPRSGRPTPKAAQRHPLRQPRAAFDVFARSLDEQVRRLMRIDRDLLPAEQTRVAAVATILASALEPRLASRPHSCAEFIDSLAKALAR
jgi:hypothetical protein